MMDSEQAMTPGYAAPEQLLGGTVTTRTDIYALGVLLCILITGKHPSAQRSLCGDLDAIVAKALKQDPDERYPSVDALADDLGLFLRNKRIGASGRFCRAAKFVRRNRLAATLFALTIAATAIRLFALAQVRHRECSRLLPSGRGSVSC